MSIFEALLQHDHVPNFYRVENTRSAPKLEDVAAETRRVMQESGTLEQHQARRQRHRHCRQPRRGEHRPRHPHGLRRWSSPSARIRSSSPPWAAMPVRRPRPARHHRGFRHDGGGHGRAHPRHHGHRGHRASKERPGAIRPLARQSEADWIIPIGCIKAHTDIRGEASERHLQDARHRHGQTARRVSSTTSSASKSMAANVKEFAGAIIEKKPNMFAIGLIENAYHQTYRASSPLRPGQIWRRSRPAGLCQEPHGEDPV